MGMAALAVTMRLAAAAIAVGAPSAQAAAKEAKHVIVDVLSIDGETFTVKDEAGTEGKIHVGSDTEKYGQVQSGDRVEAWVLPDGHVRTMVIQRSASAIETDRKQAEAERRASVRQDEAR